MKIPTVAPMVRVHDGSEIERAIDAIARDSSGGLIVLASGVTNAHRELIIGLAARHRLPAVYQFRYFVANGGLISYGHDPADQYRQAAVYLDRILKGEKPADLPVQNPTKFELVVNLKTAESYMPSQPVRSLRCDFRVCVRRGAGIVQHFPASLRC